MIGIFEKLEGHSIFVLQLSRTTAHVQVTAGRVSLYMGEPICCLFLRMKYYCQLQVLIWGLTNHT